MRIKTLLVLLLLTVICHIAFGQTLQERKAPVFTRADTLRGMLTPVRSCYDVNYYHLDVKVDPQTESIQGSNKIRFTVVTAFDEMQIDLFQNMNIERITLDESDTRPYTREFNAVFIKLPRKLEKDTEHELTVYYSGKPIVAKRPPWEGGFTWTRDTAGNPWVVVTCQGTGASLWWPNKDHQADEPDSMLISVTVPSGLMDVSNGRLRSRTELPDRWVRYDWFVSYPINNYNVTINIGKYVNFRDMYINGDTLTVDYFVMPENLARAKVQFQQVKPMLSCFEKYFGKYPFKNDGFKLVESPHTGMEHQSAVAYGNHYIQGYRGRASSPVGLKFDFIIIHESAHEWWGNSVTSKDVADMWIHESFGAYAEALYVECRFGYKEALDYINGKKASISNTRPIIGVYNVNNRGSGDMYNKGQLVLNTLRSVINNDSLWFAVLRGLAETFKYQTITTDDVVHYVNEKTGTDYTYFFDQYLKFPKIPQLEVFATKKADSVRADFKWNADVPGFKMPVKVTTSKNTYEWIYPRTSRQRMMLGDIDPREFKLADDLFYVELKLNWAYIDPNLSQ